MTYQRTIIAACVLIAAIAFTQYLSRAEDVHPSKPFSEFPTQIGPWAGVVDRFDPEIYNILGVDDSHLANYRGPDGQWANLYIGFYQSQREGELIHSPRNCMPGAGWNVADISHEVIKGLGPDPEGAKVIKLILKKGSEKQIMFYWFHSRGRIIASEYAEKIYLVLDAIFRNRTDGSFVRLITPVVNDNEQQAVDILKNFTEHLSPLLNEFIPS